MSTAADTRSVASAPSLASSVAFRTFVVVFAIAAPIIYMVCEMRNWPLFTYHPATNRIDLPRRCMCGRSERSSEGRENRKSARET